MGCQKNTTHPIIASWGPWASLVSKLQNVKLIALSTFHCVLGISSNAWPPTDPYDISHRRSHLGDKNCIEYQIWILLAFLIKADNQMLKNGKSAHCNEHPNWEKPKFFGSKTEEGI